MAGLSGLDVVVMNKAAAVGADNQTLFESLEGHWQRLGEKAGQIR